MNLAEGERADPEVSTAIAEYALMMDTGLTLADIDAMPAEQAALFLAIAERTMAKRAEVQAKLEAQSRFSR